MTRSNTVVALLASALLAAATVAESHAEGAALGLAATFVVDGLSTALAPPAIPLGDGRVLYPLGARGANWLATGTAVAKPTLFPRLGAQLSFENNSGAAVTVVATLALPIDRAVSAPTIPRLAASAALLGGASGGKLQSLGTSPMVVGLIDGAAAAGLLDAPISVVAAAWDSIVVGSENELNPVMVGPAANATIAVVWSFSLDAGCTAILSANMVVDSPDLNGDGTVDGADLGVLLANWGQSGVGDLNVDGVVDGGDLGAILAAWE